MADQGTSDPGGKELALDLTQMCLDLVGIVDPTPLSDSASALISLGRGRWLDAAISGVAVVPWVGDLAKAGKLARHAKTLERAIAAAGRTPQLAQQLLPVMQKLDQALQLFPACSVAIQRLRRLCREFLAAQKAPRTGARLRDMRKQFRFSVSKEGDLVYREASGRLGVPGKVVTERSRGAQKSVSSMTGDDAGHLIGTRFGAPGGVENLSPQNWIQNRGGGSWHQLENEWDRMLQLGHGIEVRVRDVVRAGDQRPFMRHVEWTRIAPDGRRTTDSMSFANTHTVKSRDQRGIKGRDDLPPDHEAEVIRLDEWRSKFR